jgi:hypothetical protein
MLKKKSGCQQSESKSVSQLSAIGPGQLEEDEQKRKAQDVFLKSTGPY